MFSVFKSMAPACLSAVGVVRHRGDNKTMDGAGGKFVSCAAGTTTKFEVS